MPLQVSPFYLSRFCKVYLKRQKINSEGKVPLYVRVTIDGDDEFSLSATNEAVRLIYTQDKGLPENKRGQSGDFPTLSSQVGKTERPV